MTLKWFLYPFNFKKEQKENDILWCMKKGNSISVSIKFWQINPRPYCLWSNWWCEGTAAVDVICTSFEVWSHHLFCEGFLETASSFRSSLCIVSASPLCLINKMDSNLLCMYSATFPTTGDSHLGLGPRLMTQMETLYKCLFLLPIIMTLPFRCFPGDEKNSCSFTKC